ncbi:MAG: hypothetical protein WCE52_20925 [Candidatus Acidiferrum sp.]
MRNPLVLATLGILLVAAGCGGGGSSSGGGGGTQPQSIAVTFAAAPPATLLVGATANMAAMVSNDTASKGVNWSCTPSLACGTFDPPSTASGSMTAYTAPVAVPTGGSVVITASSVTDNTKTANGTVTIPVPSITITTPAPSSLPISTAVSIAATTVNDPANPSVNWSCTPAAACGTFSVASTASGAATLYTAPATIPVGNSVTLTATSVTDNIKTANETVTITPPVVGITITTAPPVTLQTGLTASVAATTTNDAGGMVTWSCAPAGTCGSFSVSPTASGAATVYTAPAATPSGGLVTITATSVTDTTKTASAVVMENMPATNATLKGQYAFLVTAPASTRGVTTFAGSVTLDGNGGVTGGIEDVVSTGYFDLADPILVTVPANMPNTSNYAVDASGHGTLRMCTTNGETLDVSFVLTSAQHAQIIEAGGDPGSGTLDMQTPAQGGFAASQLSGAYAFTVDGVDRSNATTLIAMGGVFVANGSSQVSGTIDVNQAGTFVSKAMTGSISTGPDANGRGQIVFAPTNPQPTRTFTFYIVNSKVLRFIEDDSVDYTGGSAYAQGAAAASLLGNYVYRHGGWTTTSRTVAAGQFAATAGSVTGGISDANTFGSPTVPSVGKAVSGTYSITANLDTTVSGTATLTDAAGASMFNLYMVDPTLNILDPNNTSGNGGALLLHTDAALVGTGMVLPQSATGTTTFSGNYAVRLQNAITGTTPDEVDLVGIATASGSGVFANGLADYDENETFNASTMFGAGLTGTFAADNKNVGHYTGGFVVTPPVNGYPFFPSTTAPTSFGVSIYEASGTQAFVVETDTAATVDGELVLQQLP